MGGLGSELPHHAVLEMWTPHAAFMHWRDLLIFFSQNHLQADGKLKQLLCVSWWHFTNILQICSVSVVLDSEPQLTSDGLVQEALLLPPGCKSEVDNDKEEVGKPHLSSGT